MPCQLSIIRSRSWTAAIWEEGQGVAIEATQSRHCEEPFDAACGGAQDELQLRGSDEAIQRASEAVLDCFALLAMTANKEFSYRPVFVICSFLSTNHEWRKKMPTKRRSFLSRLVRALPVVLAAAPGVIDAVQQARRALRDPDTAPRDPRLPPV
ncbi:MAG TPA: hypothetical protein VE891_10615 [Allosphingosinicella sp.]|nr:hypothetical protein [Allosphingosinicella sp.]